MKRFMLLALPLILANNGGCYSSSDPASQRDAQATRATMDQAERQVGMPRIVNFAQKKLLKNAYEDMDQTTLTYVYTQALDGKFVCIGQALGYGVSLGTQFTASKYPQYIVMPNSNNVTEDIDQPEPNGLYAPSSGDATIVDLIDPATGQAHTALVEPHVVTVPFKLPASVVNNTCPADVDATKVIDAKETSVASYAGGDK